MNEVALDSNETCEHVEYSFRIHIVTYLDILSDHVRATDTGCTFEQSVNLSHTHGGILWFE